MRPGRRHGALALASYALVACGSVERARETDVAPARAEPGDGAPAEPARRWHGSLDTRAVARSTSGDRDLDLYQVLALDLGRREDRWSAHLTARAAWDADGRSPEFPSLPDTQGRALDGQLYSAYAKGRELGALEELVLGRHFLYDTPVVLWLDGASARTRPRGERRWTTGAFAGVPVHAYESSSGGDLAFGLYQEAHPGPSTRLRADWMHLADERAGFDGDEDLVGLSAQHDPSERLRLEGRTSWLEGDARDLSLAASWSDPGRALAVQASWYRLLESQAAHVLELDPFFGTLSTLHPYDQARLIASKDLREHLHLSGGADVRRLVDQDDVGPFNHDFARVFATATFDELLPGRAVLSLTGEAWNGEGADLETWGADVSRKWGRSSASLGSAWSLYDFDPLAGSERERVRTYYANLRVRWSDAATLGLRYELDRAEGGDFHTLRGGATWRF
jgi:hypothetical protein